MPPKTVLTLIALSVALAGSPLCASEYDNFTDITRPGLKPFARDLGGLLGAVSNHTARSLGFSGFDLGVRSAIQLKPSLGNHVLPEKQSFGLGYFQAEIGMPYRIDGFIRAGGDEGLVVSGAGLRYGLRKISDQPYYVHALVEVMGSLAAHKHFYATHFGGNLRFSMNVKALAVYAGAGLDNTVLTVQTATAVPSLVGSQVTTLEPRCFAGLKKKISYGYLAAGYAETHGRGVLEGSAGLRF